MIKHVWLSALFMGLVLASTASAQGVTGRVSPSGELTRNVATNAVRGLPSERERAYISNLYRSLGMEKSSADAGLIHRTFDRGGNGGDLGKVRGLGNYNSSNENAAPDRVRGQGLQVGVGEGSSIERLRFANAADAREYVFSAMEIANGESPGAVELRGRQVVIVRGPKAADAAFVDRALDAAWDGLPHAAGAPDARAVFLGGEGDPMILESRIDHPAFNQAFDRAIESSRGAVAGASVEGNHARIALDSGLRADIQRNEQGERLAWVTTSPERAEAISQFAQTLRERAAEEQKAVEQGGIRRKRRTIKPRDPVKTQPTDQDRPRVKPTKPGKPGKPGKPTDPYKPLVKPTQTVKPGKPKPTDPFKPLVKPTKPKPTDPYKPLNKPAEGTNSFLNGIGEQIRKK